MAGERGLDFQRRAVLSGAADDVLQAIDEVQRAVRAAAHRLAGVKPAFAPDPATSRHQVFGWKRSSCTMQPALRIIATVEQARAFVWKSGSGVMSRSSPCLSAHRPPSAT